MKFVQPIRDINKIAEIKRILKRDNYRNYFLFCFGINSGLRISDMLKLKVKDLRDKTHITITESKTNKEKRFLINEQLKSYIDDYIESMNEDDYLFQSRRKSGYKSKPISRVMAYLVLNDAAEKVGLGDVGIGCHTLRKTFGYHFYQKTKDVAVLQEIFNHSSPSITRRYIGINQDVIDNAIKDFYL